SQQFALLGAPSTEIRNLASEQNADVIVIGSHGHSGWKILLGSTANKVLHGAACDVLTVIVGKD
ncbi:MAG: universal stress protein, partial [Pseudohongiellaceae bacterium]